MANVYRRGAKSVHRSIRKDGHRFDIQACSLDAGGEWTPVIPPGPRCEACFGAPLGTRRHPDGKRPATVAAATAAALCAAVVLASSLDEPVNLLPVDTAAVSFSATPVLVTPGPSRAPSSEAPVLTPRPTRTLEPVATREPLPTFGPVPTWPPMPTFPPLPTFDLPDLPLPTLKVCRHPGEHLGVDPCKWPHQ